MSTYYELLAQAQANPDDADYHALRMAYARSDEYAPYTDHAQAVENLRNALHAEDMDAALAAIDDLLAFNYLDIETHMAADYVFVQLEDYEASGYHRAFARGLIDAILATGTGRDFGMAWIVLSIAEEYVILRVLGLIPAGQRLVEHEGHWFDILTARQPPGEATHDIYFNIDLPRGWQDDHLGG
jgi:hypothetical protein